MTDVEILIIGGGPAGLLAAACLAERHKVALIERGTLGKTTKYWVTTERRLTQHGLMHCQLNRNTAVVVGTFLGGLVKAYGDLVVVDELLFLRELVDRCVRRSVILSERCSLVNLRWGRLRLQVQTTSEVYRTRLVVDATGVSSPIATTFRLHRLDGFFNVLGAHLRRIKLHTQDIVLAYVNSLGDPPPILEVIPTGENSAYCSVFTYSRLLTPPASLDALLRKQCLKNPFFDMTAETEVVQGKAGAIAIGQRQRRELSGVVCIGEAGLVQPPLLGTAFNETLEYSERVCSHISSALDRGSGIPETRTFRYPLLKRAQDRLQLAFVRQLLRGNLEAFDWLVRFVSELPTSVVFKLYSNELTWAELFGVAVKFPKYALFRSKRTADQL